MQDLYHQPCHSEQQPLLSARSQLVHLAVVADLSAKRSRAKAEVASALFVARPVALVHSSRSGCAGLLIQSLALVSSSLGKYNYAGSRNC